MERLRHYSPAILIGMGAVVITLLWSGPYLGIARFPLALSACAVLVVGAVLGRSHSGGALCPLCAKNLPLDPGMRAQRYSFALWMVHFSYDSAIRIVVSRVFGTVVLVAVALTSGVVQQALLTILVVNELRDSVSMGIHARYAPWCPYCGHGGSESAGEPAPNAPTHLEPA
jgi:hypothetical protein